MGEADRDWNPLENRQPSPIWTSLPQAKLSSLDKATDVNSSALRLLPHSLPPWGRELRPTMCIKWRILMQAVRNVTAQRWSKVIAHERLEMGCRGIWGLKPLCEILGWVLMLAFSWQEIHPFCFSLGTSFSRSGSVPSEKKKKKKNLQCLSCLKIHEKNFRDFSTFYSELEFKICFVPYCVPLFLWPWNLGQWEWRDLS